MNYRSKHFVLLSLLLLPATLAAQGVWRPVPEFIGRAGHRMVYDPYRKVLVLFGGHHGSGFSSGAVVNSERFLSDTWEWDGKIWKARASLHRPRARAGHSMAYDAVSKRVILFGGADGQKMLGDTWAWDGQDWQQLKPRTSPAARFLHDMASDPLRGRIVLFGGSLAYSGAFGRGFSPQRDTWEWNGSDWTQKKSKTVPVQRAWHTMALDKKRGRVVMFGGNQSTFVPAPNLTWEWDGKDWKSHSGNPGFGRPGQGATMAADPKTGELMLLQFVPRSLVQWVWRNLLWQKVNVPLPTDNKFRGDTEIVLDEANKRIVLFASTRNTWTWDGASWKKVHDSSWPAITREAMVQDLVHDETLIIGTGSPTQNMSIWRLKEAGLEAIKTPTSPSPRRRPVRALFHHGLGKVWVWGGWEFGTNKQIHDIWLWDGQKWALHSSKVGPTSNGHVSYDSHRDKVLAFVFANPYQTWEWDSTSGWAKKSPSTIPPVGNTALAYDPVRQRTVLFGGTLGRQQGFSNDTWEWDGTDWTLMQPKTKPPMSWGHQLLYVPALKGILKFSGQGLLRVRHRDTWLWNGKDWRKLATNPYSIGTGFNFAVATYDANRQRVVAAYGDSNSMPHSVWEYRLETISTDQPNPRPGQGFKISIDMPGQATRPFLLALSLAKKPGIFLRLVPFVGVEVLPLAPDLLFWLSLQLGLVTSLDASGKGTVALGIPNDASLVGLDFHAAGLTLNSFAAVGAISNRLQFHVTK